MPHLKHIIAAIIILPFLNSCQSEDDKKEEARKEWQEEHSKKSKESIRKIKEQNSLRSEENKSRY